MKTDQLLDQLQGLDDLLRRERVAEARGAVAGLRHLILGAGASEEAAPRRAAEIKDETVARLLSEQRDAARLSGKAVDGRPGRSDFDETIACWGWYDSQVDGGKRRYRWCGGDPEAGMLLPYRLQDCDAIVLSLRPLQPAMFDPAAVEVAVGGRPVPTRLLAAEAGKAVRHLVLTPEAVDEHGTVAVTFYPKGAIRPIDADLGRDRRRLAFNVFTLTWLPRSAVVNGGDAR